MVTWITHSTFVRGIVMKLTDKAYTEKMLEADFEKGYIPVKGEKILIKNSKSRKNLVLATQYPFWPTTEQLDKFEEDNKEKDFYDLEIPARVFHRLHEAAVSV